ncbi:MULTISPECIES: phosphotransferase family protein [Glycomyces]|uniref:Aminoglycoside phosphotransferase (APT) family kinase protein n=1 Tax=Glycomyces lechevalierae TaxID=256034 RepID=A0A9X3TAC9_9ACTN|nr:aminoglycoside phosphotransferase family protein [Glycomyces lechevalierae]MDA1387583.1 aminoglycoside phosphotransferase family protein [Glycomyces lechevalierae]MDR7336651.1 aminoglycoside phosphotransferase (APT) family kinase protein [Glycomyces lechevalierae]
MTTQEGPQADVLRWAAVQLGATAAVVSATGMREGGNPWLLRIDHDGQVIDAVLKTVTPEGVAGMATEVAALRVANRAGVPAPRILAVDASGEAAGTRAVLETAVPGRSRIPLDASPQRLRGLGAAVAALHSITTRPSPELPRRTRPIPASDFARDRREGRERSTPLLDAADDRVTRLPVPDSAPVLVHGDLWQGNTMWQGDRLTGLLDWDMAGVGHYGIDLSSLRLDAALTFGQGAAGSVLDGWEQRSGIEAADLAYWDAVAALNMPSDMAEFLPAIHDQGRPDLTAEELNTRRDAFLRAAIDRL